MTTKTDEQERAEFEAWCKRNEYDHVQRLDGTGYNNEATKRAWKAWQARATLQHSCKETSQDREDAERLDFLSRADIMGCSLVSDDDGRWAFSDSGVAPVPPNGGFTEYASIVSLVEPDMWKEDIREAIDHARRVEGDGE